MIGPLSRANQDGPGTEFSEHLMDSQGYNSESEDISKKVLILEVFSPCNSSKFFKFIDILILILSS